MIELNSIGGENEREKLTEYNQSVNELLIYVLKCTFQIVRFSFSLIFKMKHKFYQSIVSVRPKARFDFFVFKICGSTTTTAKVTDTPKNIYTWQSIKKIRVCLQIGIPLPSQCLCDVFKRTNYCLKCTSLSLILSIWYTVSIYTARYPANNCGLDKKKGIKVKASICSHTNTIRIE